MSRGLVLIDGGYLKKVLDGFGRPKIDFAKLAAMMASGNELLRAYYCRPYVGSNPTLADQRRLSDADNFFKALQRLPRYQVRLGHLAFRGHDAQGRLILEQKRVDTMLAIGVLIQLWHGEAGSFHRELWDACDERVEITSATVQQILMPPPVTLTPP